MCTEEYKAKDKRCVLSGTEAELEVTRGLPPPWRTNQQAADMSRMVFCLGIRLVWLLEL